MALTATQQRNMERLLGGDINDLRDEGRKRIHQEYAERRDEITNQWYAANPQIAAVDKKARAYAKRVNKRMRELDAEHRAAMGAQPHDANRNVWVPDNPFGTLNRAPELEALLHAETIRRDRRDRNLQQRVQELHHTKMREILLATLDSSQEILTLPSLDELLAEPTP